MFNSLVLYGTYIAKDFRYNEQFELNEQRIQTAIFLATEEAVTIISIIETTSIEITI